MSEFVPVKPKKQKDPVYLRLSEDLNRGLNLLAEKTGIRKTEIMRQMIAHCLRARGIAVEQSGQSWNEIWTQYDELRKKA